MTAPGLFITFEGGDGVGKTTQAEAARAFLEAQGHQVLRTREPGGTDLGVEIRTMVLHRKGDIDPHAEALLFAADRAQHVNKLVKPALAAGTHVVQDRYIDSSVAYQGAGRALDTQEILDLSIWATQNLMPDLTILLDLDPAAAAARVAAENKGFDRMEAEKADFRSRLRRGFLDIADKNPGRVIVIDAALDVQAIGRAIEQAILIRLRNHRAVNTAAANDAA